MVMAPTALHTLNHHPLTSSRSSKQSSHCFDMFPAVVAVVRRTPCSAQSTGRCPIRGKFEALFVCLFSDLRAKWAWSRSTGAVVHVAVGLQVCTCSLRRFKFVHAVFPVLQLNSHQAQHVQIELGSRDSDRFYVKLLFRPALLSNCRQKARHTKRRLSTRRVMNRVRSLKYKKPSFNSTYEYSSRRVPCRSTGCWGPYAWPPFGRMSGICAADGSSLKNYKCFRA